MTCKCGNLSLYQSRAYHHFYSPSDPARVTWHHDWNISLSKGYMINWTRPSDVDVSWETLFSSSGSKESTESVLRSRANYNLTLGGHCGRYILLCNRYGNGMVPSGSEALSFLVLHSSRTLRRQSSSGEQPKYGTIVTLVSKNRPFGSRDQMGYTTTIRLCFHIRLRIPLVGLIAKSVQWRVFSVFTVTLH